MKFWPALTLTPVLALGLGLGTVHLIPLAVRLGVSPSIADELPFLGFLSGALGGISAAFSKSTRSTLATAFAVIAFGAVAWLCGVLIEGLLVAAQLDEARVSWVSTVAFCLGIGAGTLALSLDAFDEMKRLLLSRSPGGGGGARRPAIRSSAAKSDASGD